MDARTHHTPTALRAKFAGYHEGDRIYFHAVELIEPTTPPLPILLCLGFAVVQPAGFSVSSSSMAMWMKPWPRCFAIGDFLSRPQARVSRDCAKMKAIATR